MKKRHQQKLIVLSFIIISLFNIPIILLFDSSDSIIGLPINLCLYFFCLGFVSINFLILF